MVASSNQAAPLVIVAGITGQQGGSVADALIGSPDRYRIRGLTRDAGKESARKWVEKGVDVKEVNIVVGNEEAVKAALHGADYVFFVTQFWEHVDLAKEVAESKMVVDIARSLPTLKLFIWSGLPSTSGASQGKYTRAIHFEGKAQVTSYLQETGCPFIDVQAGWYMQNFLSVLKPSPEGQIVLPLDPHVKLPVIDIRDYGLWVLAGIEGKIEKGKSVQVFGEEITLAELVREIEDVTGKPTTYQKVAAKDLPLMKGVPEFLIGVFHDNYSSWEEFGYFGTWVLEIPTYLKRKPKTWKEFAVENKDLFY
ncbi:NAD(P)-binding protein [Atractiella rhizophila]|nr:NAD(P)-binding protein [Atractiella rhizophila]